MITTDVIIGTQVKDSTSGLHSRIATGTSREVNLHENSKSV